MPCVHACRELVTVTVRPMVVLVVNCLVDEISDYSPILTGTVTIYLRACLE